MASSPDQMISYSGGIVTYTVPLTGTYDVTAFGAQGGASTNITFGGLGAEIGADVFLTAGETLEILVGGVGQDGISGPDGYDNMERGGGGGVVIGNDPASGGGGGSFEDGGAGGHGTTVLVGPVTTATSGTGGFGGGCGSFSVTPAQVAIAGENAGYGSVTIEMVCFLRGTRIATPDGERAVEDLAEGDLVLTAAGDASPVTWIGHRALTEAEGREPGYAPVRIRAGAVSDNVPHRDLLVTPEHCILVDGVLIPARMLVNGRSIILDGTLGAFEFFHVELAEHSILLSEGLSTESYLDTGNRALLAGSGTVVTRRTDRAMAAPLAVERATVEPIWRRLDARATALGHPPVERTGTLTQDPLLRLLLEDGRAVAAGWHDDTAHRFRIPRGSRPVRLVSRAAVPARVIGPFVDDRRSLGVLVERIVLWRGVEATVLPAAGLGLRGWHDVEGSCRWTDGGADLDLPEADDDMVLDVRVVATMRYDAHAAC